MSLRGSDLPAALLRQAGATEAVRPRAHGREAIRLAGQVVLRPPKAVRRIFSCHREIPRFARDSALHWIAAPPWIKSGVARNDRKGSRHSLLGERGYGVLGSRTLEERCKRHYPKQEQIGCVGKSRY